MLDCIVFLERQTGALETDRIWQITCCLFLPRTSIPHTIGHGSFEDIRILPLRKPSGDHPFLYSQLCPLTRLAGCHTKATPLTTPYLSITRYDINFFRIQPNKTNLNVEKLQ